MSWHRTLLWIAIAGMILVGVVACGGKAVAPPDTSADRPAGSPKTVMGENALNGTSFKTTVDDGKTAAEEKEPEGRTHSFSSGPAAETGPARKQEAGPGTILNEPSRFTSGTVTVRGAFRGWRGPCRGGPPVSRGDWMIADATGCLYVHGPVPPGLDPAMPSGDTVTVTGTVRMKNGLPYIEAAGPLKP
jgi:hypothetical protein